MPAGRVFLVASRNHAVDKPLSTPPLPYGPGDEQHQPDEAKTHAALRADMHAIQETTFRDYGHAVRSVHAKSHGLLRGELRVLDGLPPELAQGMFARPATYPVVLRISTNPGDILDDDISSPRGLALKVFGVEGERLPGSEGDVTQDFVMANAPAFAAPDTASFAGNLKLLALTTDSGQAWKKGFSAVLRGAEAAVEAFGAKSPMLTTMGGHPITHPLGETFYSQVPFRHGSYVAKLAVSPVSPELLALKDAKVDLAGRPNGLREEVIAFFRDGGGEWELRVQLRTDANTMPIEDASVAWPEDASPYMAVARISVPPQPAWNEARARVMEDGLAFSPWHGLAAHRPLGGINRSRREAYAMAAGFRGEHNGCPMAEPRQAPVPTDGAAQAYGTTRGREGRRPGTPDARPGAWTSPMSDGPRHIVAGAAGGLAAGIVLSAVIAGMAARSGGPSELGELERRTAGRLGLPHRPPHADAVAGEEITAHLGHLALSAVAGAGYGLATRGDGASPVGPGLAFGLGFYTLAYGIAGPALGVARAPWRDSAGSVAQHVAMHAAFGVLTAFLTDRVARRMQA